MSSQLQKDDMYKNFIVTKSLPIPELECYFLELRHIGTGAKVLHISMDDPENFFCISFRTLPNSSNGIAHVLEHTVLCGSQKYPVRDPFFSMSGRSLNTFMNALTGADFTCYPAASQIEKDFYNLLSVYIDAVFYPKLTPLSLAQEGIHLAFENNDIESSLQFKGVVFNEMKGALSSPSRRLLEEMSSILFKDNPYGYNSGGDPKELPSLTHQELVDFHKEYYHPSHALFFFYGDLPLEKHLDFIADHILDKSTKVEKLPPIPKQKRFTHPLYHYSTYPISEAEYREDKTEIGFGWLTCTIKDQLDLLALCILDIVLMDTDGSVLKQRLLTSGLCKQAYSMLDVEINEIPFVLSVKGCKEEDADKIEKIIFDTLQEFLVNPIPKELIESALHQLEFHRSEFTHDYGPFGLLLFYRAGLLVQHGGEAEDGLCIQKLFATLHESCEEDPLFFQRIVEKYFVRNPHFVRLVFTPDSTLGEKERKEEEESLEKIQKALSKQEKEAIVAQCQHLEQLQEEEEVLDCLPEITIEDIPKLSRCIHLKKEDEPNFSLFHTASFTNSITYATLSFDLPALAQDKLWIAQLFSSLLSQVGAANRNYIDNLAKIQQDTGSISTCLVTYLQATNCNAVTPALQIHAKALFRKAPELFSLMYDIASSPNLQDIQRIEELIKKYHSGIESGISSNPLKYCIRNATRHLGENSLLNTLWNGIDYFYKIKELVSTFKENPFEFIQELESIKELLLTGAPTHLILTTSAKELIRYKEENFYGLAELAKKPAPHWKQGALEVPTASAFEVWESSTKVAFTAAALPGLSYAEPEAAYLSLAASIFDNTTLHKRVREQGGAYGVGAMHNPMTGIFYFQSSRDPNIASTYKAFLEAIERVSSGHFSDAELDEAKRELIQSIDMPISPSSKSDVAYGRYREGKSDALRQHFRMTILNSSREAVIAATRKYLLEKISLLSFVSFAPRALIDKEIAHIESIMKKPLERKKI